jgi:general stress protein 26
MDEKTAMSKGLELVERSKIALLGTNGPGGYPHIKALLNLKHLGLKEFWFSTNTTSRRVKQVVNDGKTCLYFVDPDSFEGLMLLGHAEITQEPEIRGALWFEGSEKYYPRGVEDPDYSVIHFTSFRGNYYHGLCSIYFDTK